jgi:hypothetical protein
MLGLRVKALHGRSTLRLPPELWAAIDGARDKRPGNVSRNTWVVEAITEKLAKEQQNAAESKSIYYDDQKIS